jgi:hypothetical protein
MNLRTHVSKDLRTLVQYIKETPLKIFISNGRKNKYK